MSDCRWCPSIDSLPSENLITPCPIECVPNWLCVNTSCVHLMSHCRNFMDEIKGFLRDEEQFVLSFVKTSRKHYGRFLFPKHTSTPSKKWLSDASVKHTVEGFVKEVM